MLECGESYHGRNSHRHGRLAVSEQHVLIPMENSSVVQKQTVSKPRARAPENYSYHVIRNLRVKIRNHLATKQIKRKS